MLQQLTYWHWFILAALLIILEVFAPGAFMLWIGIAAGVVGTVLYFAPGMTWEYQFILFSIASVGSILAWRGYRSAHPVTSDEPTLNRRGAQYIGRVFTLDTPIVNGIGKIRVDDSTWKIEGADCPVGTKIKVVGIENTVLRVEVAG
ncbi:MAG: NfeD family protein [Gammaproteobacteria bacterium]|nr:NfeD family protein [Gammaproteobacteria bacterium]